jgi:hypothetical protein
LSGRRRGHAIGCLLDPERQAMTRVNQFGMPEPLVEKYPGKPP